MISVDWVVHLYRLLLHTCFDEFPVIHLVVRMVNVSSAATPRITVSSRPSIQLSLCKTPTFFHSFKRCPNVFFFQIRSFQSSITEVGNKSNETKTFHYRLPHHATYQYSCFLCSISCSLKISCSLVRIIVALSKLRISVCQSWLTGILCCARFVEHQLIWPQRF